MKKARIMLTAIAVMATVGGALAYRANQFLYVQMTPGVGDCNIKKLGAKTTSTGNVIPIRFVNPGPCNAMAATTTTLNN